MTLTNPPSSFCDIRSWLYGVKDEIDTLSTANTILNTNYSQNRVLASPDGSTGLLSVRALVKNDLPATTWSTPNHIGSATPAQGSFTKVTLNSTSVTNAGDLAYDSTTSSIRYYNGATLYVPGYLAKYYNTRTIASTAAETTLFPASLFGTATLPANYMTAGTRIHVMLEGEIQSVNTVDTITFRSKLGSTTLSTSNAYARSTTNTRPFFLELIITCRTTGVSGTVSSVNRFMDMVATPASAVWSSVESTTINTTTSQTIAITGQWSASNASNSLKIYGGVIMVY